MDLITFPPNPRSTWKKARTLDDLGRLSARWLEGEFDECPSYGGPPDPETTGLIPTLAAVNRAGFLTDQSQPGRGERTSWDGLPYWQRAAVQGYVANGALARWLCSIAENAGELPGFDVGTLWVSMQRATRRRWDWKSAWPVTLGADGVHTSFGYVMPRRHLRWQFGSWCSKPAIDAVCGAWQVTIVDPVWGRNDVLWPALDRFVRELTVDEFAGLTGSSDAVA
jgi:Domain of unknown function (DUF6919)